VKLFGISENFIEIYDNALTKKECEILVSQFEKLDKVDGTIVVEDQLVQRPDIKKCRQLEYSNFSDKSIISNIVHPQLGKCLHKYFKKYESEDDGFKVWHCEHGGDPSTSSRLLAWMFYLNDAKSGTEFMHYSNVRAKRGRCVIWPAFWTHTHRGVVPNRGLKYIVTGWASYDV
jgi:hypothetical protein